MESGGGALETRKLLGNNQKQQSDCNSGLWFCQPKYIGYFNGIFNAVVFVTIGGTSQALGEAVPTFELNTLRYLSLFVVCLVINIAFKMDVFAVFKKETLPFFIAYVLLIISQMVMLFVSINYISFTTMSCLKQSITVIIGFLVPLVWARVCKVSHGVAATLCVIGTVFLVQPDFIFPNSSLQTTQPVCGSEDSESTESKFGNQSMFAESTTVADDQDISNSIYPGYILASVGSVCITIMLFIGNGPLTHLNAPIMLLWTSVLGTLSMAIIMAIAETPTFPSSATCIALLFGHLGGFTLNQLLFVSMSLTVTPLMNALLFSVELLTGLIAQYTVLKNINAGHQNVLEVVGAFIVILGNIVGPCYQVYEMRKEEKKATAEQKLELSKPE